MIKIITQLMAVLSLSLLLIKNVVAWVPSDFGTCDTNVCGVVNGNITFGECLSLYGNHACDFKDWTPHSGGDPFTEEDQPCIDGEIFNHVTMQCENEPPPVLDDCGLGYYTSPLTNTCEPLDESNSCPVGQSRQVNTVGDLLCQADQTTPDCSVNEYFNYSQNSCLPLDPPIPNDCIGGEHYDPYQFGCVPDDPLPTDPTNDPDAPPAPVTDDGDTTSEPATDENQEVISDQLSNINEYIEQIEDNTDTLEQNTDEIEGLLQSLNQSVDNLPDDGTGRYDNDIKNLLTEIKNQANQVQSQTSGGLDCTAPPTCTGDAIQCSVLLQTWQIRCQHLNESEIVDTSAQQYQPIEETVFDILPDINSILSATSPVTATGCNTDTVLSMNYSNVTVPTSMVCQVASNISPLILAIAAYLSLAIVAASLRTV